MLTLYYLHAIDSIYRWFIERKKEKNKKEGIIIQDSIDRNPSSDRSTGILEIVFA